MVPLRSPVRRGSAGRLPNIDGWQRTLSPDGRLDRVLRLSSRARRRSPGRRPRRPRCRPVRGARQPTAQPRPDRRRPRRLGDAGPVERPLDRPDAVAVTERSARPGRERRQRERVVRRRQQRRQQRRQRRSDAQAVQGGGLGPDLAGGVPSAGSQPHRRCAAVRRPGRGGSARAAEGQRPDGGLRPGRRVRATRRWPATGWTHPTNLVAPTGGYLPPTALRRVGDTTPVVLTQAALPDADTSVVAPPARAPVVLTDAAAGSRRSRAELAVRRTRGAAAAAQRRGSARPLRQPGRAPRRVAAAVLGPRGGLGQADFFGGLSQPWLQMIDLRRWSPPLRRRLAGHSHTALPTGRPRGTVTGREPGHHPRRHPHRCAARPAAQRQRQRRRRRVAHRDAGLVVQHPQPPGAAAHPGGVDAVPTCARRCRGCGWRDRRS